MGGEALVLRARHDRPEEDGPERAALSAVVGEVAVRLAEGRDDLRHLQPERAGVRARQRRAWLRASFS